MKNDDFVLLTGTSNLDLSKKVGKFLKQNVSQVVSRFSDGEVRVVIPENLEKKRVFIIQSTCPPVEKNLMELLLITDAAKRAKALEITAVIPYFGYSRQDRKEKEGTPVAASLVASLIERSGATKIITVDIHSKAGQVSVKIPWVDLYAGRVLIQKLKSPLKNNKNLIIVSPDKGGILRAKAYAKLLNANEVAIVYKERDIHKENVSRVVKLVGDVSGKDVLIIDDMIDTGGTLLGATELIQKNGAKSISAVVTHGIFSGSAMKNIQKSSLKEIFVTDSVPQKSDGKTKVVSIAKLLSDAILGLVRN